MKKYFLSSVFVFTFVLVGLIFTKPAFAKECGTSSSIAGCKVGDCNGGDRLGKNGLWYKDSTCGGAIVVNPGSKDVFARTGKSCTNGGKNGEVVAKNGKEYCDMAKFPNPGQATPNDSKIVVRPGGTEPTKPDSPFK